MTMSSRGVTLIDTLSAILLIAAIALYFWPVRVDTSATATVLASIALPNIAAETAPSTDVETIIAANILSASRRAPASRYSSPDRAVQAEFALPPAFAAPAEPNATEKADAADEVPSLYGIVNIDGTSRALLRLSESDVNPVLLREGDKRGAYRVVSIRSNAVIIAGPSGQRTLRLTTPARGDSTGKQL